MELCRNDSGIIYCGVGGLGCFVSYSDATLKPCRLFIHALTILDPSQFSEQGSTHNQLQTVEQHDSHHTIPHSSLSLPAPIPFLHSATKHLQNTPTRITTRLWLLVHCRGSGVVVVVWPCHLHSITLRLSRILASSTSLDSIPHIVDAESPPPQLMNPHPNA